MMLYGKIYGDTKLLIATIKPVGKTVTVRSLS